MVTASHCHSKHIVGFRRFWLIFITCSSFFFSSPVLVGVSSHHHSVVFGWPWQTGNYFTTFPNNGRWKNDSDVLNNSLKCFLYLIFTINIAASPVLGDVGRWGQRPTALVSTVWRGMIRCGVNTWIPAQSSNSLGNNAWLCLGEQGKAL